MKKVILWSLVGSLLLVACSQKPEALLREVQSNIQSTSPIAFKEQALFQTPMGTFDTIRTSVSFRKNENSITGYDFIVKRDETDFCNIDGIYKEVKHSDKTILLFSKEESEREKRHIRSVLEVKFSPVMLLQEPDWTYVSDTLMNGKKLTNFYRVEKDTIIEGNAVYTEQHIFLNPETKLVDRWERRNFYKGNPSQKIIYRYLDYKFGTESEQLSYEYPANYTSKLYGKRHSVEPLKPGEEAPLFSVIDLQNTSFDLKDFRGKKVLLDFSIIRCGNCIMALDYVNQKDYKLSDDIVPLYINPFDDEKEVKAYVAKKRFPFPLSLMPRKWVKCMA
jgi:hypothetical protein